MKIAYLRFCEKLQRAGLPRDPAEGPLDYARRLARARPDLEAPAGAITRLYVALRYGAEVGQSARVARSSSCAVTRVCGVSRDARVTGRQPGSWRQQLQRIHRLAEAADLEVELDLVGVGVAHLGDLLALARRSALPSPAARCCGRRRSEKRVVVLDDDQLAEAADAGAAEDDAPRRARVAPAGRLAGDAYALQVRAVVEGVDDLAARGPAELDVLALARLRGCRRCGFGLRLRRRPRA